MGKRIAPHRVEMIAALTLMVKGRITESEARLAKGRELMNKYYSRKQKPQ